VTEFVLYLFLHWGLAHDSFEVRQRVSGLLDASPALQSAVPKLMLSKDCEVRFRARMVDNKHGITKRLLEKEKAKALAAVKPWIDMAKAKLGLGQEVAELIGVPTEDGINGR